MDDSKISPSLLPHLNEIAKRLWSGHAAIMVGAGFSKNAVPLDDSVKGFPDWNQLGEIFYEKARGRKIGSEKFLSPLKLADEVQASFDRPTLHKLLEDSIPNNEYEPSGLHVKLLDLPWADVFTTNYDTLLERATKSVSDYSYQTVVNTEGLVYSKSSRIVKLHGSFPDSKPFIISEEDYRRYPTDFAPFVNTVQQALLENTLVLVGFSGDDPNFLRWVGWIRDNLGQDNSPNIYIVGILNLTKAQELLFIRNKIIPIDMSDLDGVGRDDYYIGLEKFFDFCACKKAESDRLDWPNGDEYSSPDYNDNKIHGVERTEKEQAEKDQNECKQAEKVSLYWKGQRCQFPGWVVVPEDRRKELWRGTYNWVGYVDKSIKFTPMVRLSFVFEYFWRVEKCLCPIFDNQIEAITSVLDIYIQPLSKDGKISGEVLNDMTAQNISESEVRDKASFLILTLLRYYREEGKLDCWRTLSNESGGILKREDDLARLTYERALFCLFQFDLDSVNSIASNWDVDETMPFWLAKKAGLLAELGKSDEAIDKLERALNAVRAKQNLKPVTIDYSLVSQESYILVLLKYVKDGKAHSEGDYGVRTKFSERWNELKQFKCDPWNEIKLLEEPLKVEPKSKTDVTVKKEFDIGRTTRTRHFGRSDEDALNAFGMLKFYEDVGIPPQIPGSSFSDDVINGVFKRIYEHVPYWVLATMLRAGNSKSVEYVINRTSLDFMTLSEVETLSANYISIFNKFSFEQRSARFHQDSSLKRLLPEVLSRLCSKSTEATQRKLFELLLNIYQAGDAHSFDGTGNLTRRLMETITESNLLGWISILLKFPILDDAYLVKNNFPNPFNFLRDINVESLNREFDFSIDEHVILSYLEVVASEQSGKRTRCIHTLMELNRLKLLDEEQQRLFSIALWDELDETGFPAHTECYKFVFCENLAPEAIDSQLLIKNYVLEAEIPSQNKSSGVSLGGGKIPLCYEIIGASRFVSWSSSEAHILFRKLVSWWDKDKEYLESKKDDPVRGEFYARFKLLQSTLISVISTKIDTPFQEDIESLRRIVFEMKGRELPVSHIQSKLILIIPEWKQDIGEMITTNFLHTDDFFISDAVEAIHSLLKKEHNNSDMKVIRSVLGLFSTTFQYRDVNRLKYALGAGIRVLVNYESYFSDEFEKTALFSLDKLIVETTNKSQAFEPSDALMFRELSAQLAYKIFCFYEENKKEIPDVILRWKAVCESENEFLEIRNKWVF
jgi:hypothetical protein